MLLLLFGLTAVAVLYSGDVLCVAAIVWSGLMFVLGFQEGRTYVHTSMHVLGSVAGAIVAERECCVFLWSARERW